MLLDFESLVKLHNLKISGIVHIGAHYGQEWKTYKKNNIKNVIFFEPLKENFAKLKENVKDEAILINCALGNSIQKIEMNVEVANQSQSSSILKPKMHLQQYPNIIFDRRETVDMITLDSYFKENKNNDFNLINIDVQGYELEVFKGAKETLSKIDYIIAEVNRTELYENCASVIEIDQYLGSYGFSRVETNWEGVTWGDALYVKSKQI